MWLRFLPHFGIIDKSRIIGIEDLQAPLELPAGDELIFIPTHFLHSAGHYSAYDARSKVLFTSDIGAAVFEPGSEYLFVENFDEHRKLMEGFHKRYMSSGKACRKWVEIVSQYEIEMIAPQHGAIFQKETVPQFLDWFRSLRCGIDDLDTIYGS